MALSGIHYEMFQGLLYPVTERHLRHSTQSTAAVLQRAAAPDTFLLLRSNTFNTGSFCE